MKRSAKSTTASTGTASLEPTAASNTYACSARRLTQSQDARQAGVAGMQLALPVQRLYQSMLRRLQRGALQKLLRTWEFMSAPLG